MENSQRQLAGAVRLYQLQHKCTDFNQATHECCEEIYKVTYSYWYWCHRKYRRTGDPEDQSAAELKFMIDIVPVVD